MGRDQWRRSHHLDGRDRHATSCALGALSWTTHHPVDVLDEMRAFLVVVAMLIVSGCGSGRSHLNAASPGTTSRAINSAVSVRRGKTRVVYVVNGRSGPIGSFVGSCAIDHAPHTSYRAKPQAADATVAVDGRGASRAAAIGPSQRLQGGTSQSGLEHWLVRMGRESEEVTLEASLEIVRERGSPDCTFWLLGSVTVLRR